MSGDDDDPLASESETERPPTEQATVDSATRGGRRKQENKLQREFRERQEFWRGVLDNPVGRRELWRTIFGSNATHVAETRFPAGPAGFPDANAAWWERGRQDIGTQILAELTIVYRDGVFLMQDEYDSRFPRPPKPKKGE